MKASDRFTGGPARATCACCGRVYQVLNLSLGGFFLAGESHANVGQTMRIEIVAPDRPSLEVVVLVAWINETENPKAPELPHGFGVRIQKIDMVAKLALLQYLRRIEEQRVR